MKKALLLLLLATCSVLGQSQSVADSVEFRHGAFYEGELVNYVVHPPSGFQLVQEEAAEDGYSFAFIPESLTYRQSNILIGANIYKIRGLKFNNVVREDTLALRNHYGDSLSIWHVDSVTIGSGQPIPTFFVNDPHRFVPNVMISYFDGGSEIIIFELVISEHVLRTDAEEKFMACLQGVKALERKQLGDG
jgi:hypothetical protein